MGWTFASEPCDDAVTSASSAGSWTRATPRSTPRSRTPGRRADPRPRPRRAPRPRGQGDRRDQGESVARRQHGQRRRRGGLAPAELEAQVDRSLESLGDADVDLLYLHAPDAATPIERTLEALAIQHERRVPQARTQQPPRGSASGCTRCVTRSGFPDRTRTRDVQLRHARGRAELLPALRALDMRFLAYNPLAGGLLTGKHEAAAAATKTRRPRGGVGSRRIRVLDRFWRPEYFAEWTRSRRRAGARGVDRRGREPALVVLALETGRGEGRRRRPGREFGAHLEANLGAAARRATLPDDVLDSIEAGFEMCAGVQPPYSRGPRACSTCATGLEPSYSKDLPSVI